MKPIVALILVVVLAGCRKTDDAVEATLTGRQVQYAVTNDAGSTVANATLAERNDGSALLTLRLMGTGATSASLNFGPATDNGAVAVSLAPFDAAGQSRTVLTALANGQPLSYNDLLVFDGHLRLLNNAQPVARADVGGNTLTGQSRSFTLNPADANNIGGRITFSQRNNGFTLIQVALNNTATGNAYPAHVHLGSNVFCGGAIAVTLNPIEGGTGRSATSIRAYDSTEGQRNGGAALSYAQLVQLQSCYEVHRSATDNAVVAVY
jgi:hypothetical protein